MTIRKRRLGVEATLISASLLLGATGSLAPLASHRNGHDFDLVASAHPASPHTSDTDSTAAFERGHGKQIKADASATSSATCDSCRGSATALQVISLDNTRQATTDNTATAWSSCRDCGATSVSLQVVVMRPGTSLTTRNRALAVNTSCERCTTAAVAVQLVVVSKDSRTLSRDGRERLEALAAQVGAQLRNTALAKGVRAAQAHGQAGLPGLDALISDELNPMTVQRHLDVKTG